MSSLMLDYKEFCSFRSGCIDTNVLDLSDVTFFKPTTLLPIAALIKEKEPRVHQPRNKDAKSYLKTVTDGSQFRRFRFHGKSYLPVVSLPNQQDQVSDILQSIYKIHSNGKDCGGETAFKYLIGEIVTNIYEHSKFQRSWVMAQAYKKLGYLDICFFDDGITINGCFKEHNIVCYEDNEAIIEAINGLSTKSEERGHGLNSNMKIFTRGIKGQILIISGNGGLSISPNQNQQSYTLKKTYELSGTMISVRIPYPAPDVNIFNYL